MNILAIGDPHGKLPTNLKSIIKKNNIDIIICVGDIPLTQKRPWEQRPITKSFRERMEKSYKKILSVLASFGIPVLILEGNMPFKKNGKNQLNSWLKPYKNIIKKHLGKHKIKNINFVLFNIIYEHSSKRNKNIKFSKKEIQKIQNKKKKLNRLLKENPNSILIAHNPPYGVVDKAFNGKHVGSKILAEAIKKNQPKLVLCGHIHEAKGEGKIGKTKIYNLGSHGDYKILKI